MWRVAWVEQQVDTCHVCYVLGIMTTGPDCVESCVGRAAGRYMSCLLCTRYNDNRSRLCGELCW